MHATPVLGLVAWMLAAGAASASAAEPASPPLPEVAEGWKAELVVQAPAIVFPTAIVAAPDGTVYLGQDPMDMPGPPTVPNDSVVAIRGGKVAVFAEKLWAVMGLEWADGTLYVVHPPYLSAFRDTDGDGKADNRDDLVTGLGPKVPGFNGLNDHVASGVRLGMDGFLYVSVGDKGIPRGQGKDGTTVRLHGGGVIRVRPAGTGLEVVSTGERNPLSVALSATDEVFTYGNDDDSKQWPNSLTHHIVGGHYGYPYDFLAAPQRCLPVMAGEVGGSGAQGLCYNEDGLPDAYRGNLFFCDWGLQTVVRYTVERHGGTFRVASKRPFVTKGKVDDFRPFSIAVAPDGASFYLVDWAYNGWLADGPKTGRLYRVSYVGKDRPKQAPRPRRDDPSALLAQGLEHPALAVRLDAQRALARLGPPEVPALAARLGQRTLVTGRLHALWALDAIGTPEARRSIRVALADPEPEVRFQAARSAGIRGDVEALPALGALLADRTPAVRREAAIALGKLGDRTAAPGLMAALGDPDPFVAWSVRHAIRSLNAWDVEALAAALLDEKRRDDGLKLTDEAWAVPVVEALTRALGLTKPAAVRARIVANLAGLYRKYPEWSGNWFGTNPLAGQLPVKTQPWDAPGMTLVQNGLTVALKDQDAAVRLQAIAGLLAVGRPAAPALRAALTAETDPKNLGALAGGLGVLGDLGSVPALAGLVRDAGWPESVRIAALEGIGRLRGPQALNARLMVVYDEKAPASLVARALPALGREGVLPPNDLAGFLGHADPAVRASALLALTARKQVPEEVRESVLARLDDPDADVRRAAMQGAVSLRLSEAVPRLLAAAHRDATRSEATLALAGLPDPRALPVYLSALSDRSPEVRRAGESALLAIRDDVAPDLEKAAQSGRYPGPAVEALEHILARFRPVTAWKVIGPFPRTTAQVFFGEPSIDFGRTHAGAEGRTIAWVVRAGDPATGRVTLDDLKAGAGDRGGFGYDTNGSPDLAAFASTEIESDRDRTALLRVGSSGTVILSVNEKAAHAYVNFAGRPYRPDADVVRVELKRGKNRLLVQARQGIGVWSFGVQVSEPSALVVAGASRKVGPEERRAFALRHEGDPKSGEALFFDAKGIGCVNCHAANGRGTANIGPDLTGLALKYDKAEIIRSVLEPSNRIATGYQPVLVATRDGKVVTGVVRSETDAYLELADPDAKVVRIAKPDIEERKIGDVSVMPPGLADSLSVVEFSDLISYLKSLKSAPTAVAPSATGRR
jgi:putative membrane-bound dehydrogenase-like protein